MNSDDAKLNPMFLRQRAGLTQFQAAIEIGRSPSTIAKWEARETVLRGTPSEIKRVCDVYKCTLEELIQAFEGPQTESQN